MINSLIDLGKYIYSVLSTDDTLHASLGTKIYPLVADNDTKFPFVVYKRLSLESNGCKDGYYQDIAEYQITVITDKYAPGLEIAQRIRFLLERQDVSYGEDITIDSVLSFATEDYNDGFVQTLHFRFTVKKY